MFLLISPSVTCLSRQRRRLRIRVRCIIQSMFTIMAKSQGLVMETVDFVTVFLDYDPLRENLNFDEWPVQ